MAAEENSVDTERGPPLEEALEELREWYVEKHGEEPPAEFIQKARTAVIRELAGNARDDHREVYDALADE